MKPAAALVAALSLAACSSGSVVTRGEGLTLTAAAAPGLAGRYRIAVGAIVDKTTSGDGSQTQQLAAMNADRAEIAQLQPTAITDGIRDMLITELFGVGRFIVLERAALDDVITEQEFAASARAGDKTRIPKGQLEGAELIVVGALTAFDAGVSGGALPVPVPLGDKGDFGIAHIRFKRGYVALDVRVIDARTGRVLSVATATGRNSRFGFDFDVFSFGAHHSVHLPGVLTYFSNTPVEKALQEMVILAVRHVAERVPAVSAAP